VAAAQTLEQENYAGISDNEDNGGPQEEMADKSGLGKFWKLDDSGKRKRKPKEAFISARYNAPDETCAEFLEAKRRELQSFEDQEVFVRCRRDQVPSGTQVIATKWVCKWKVATDADDQHSNKSAKARLVAKGFQENVVDEFVDSPTATRDSLRTAAFLAAQNDWQIRSIDIKTAFLQSDARTEKDKQIAILPPKEANEDANVVWLLRRSIYGLRSAPKSWWLTLVCVLLSLGFTQCKHDIATPRTGRTASQTTQDWILPNISES